MCGYGWSSLPQSFIYATSKISFATSEGKFTTSKSRALTIATHNSVSIPVIKIMLTAVKLILLVV